MRRWLRPILLLSCIAIAMFFAIGLIRSLSREDLFIARTRVGMFALGTYRGGMQLYMDMERYEPASAVMVWADAPARPFPAPQNRAWYHAFDFAISDTSIDSRLHEYLRSPGVLGSRLEHRKTVCLPFWSLMLLFWAPPLVWLNRTVRADRRRRQGLCAGCGFDMSKGHDRCPECGRENDIDFIGQ